MKKRLGIYLLMIILIIPLIFANVITGSTPQNKEDIENYEKDFCETDYCDTEILNDNNENSITGSVTEEKESKGFFKSFIDWIKNLFS